MSGEQRLLLAFEMSIFARELAEGRYPARPSRVDGGTGRTGTVKAGVPPGVVAGRAAMAWLMVSVSDVFRRVTTALDQAGIGYMLSPTS
jgi:hypothetical protein